MNERIKMLRGVLNLTQEQFAEQLSLTRNYISLVENGTRTFADRTIKDICRTFDVNESWLRTGEGEMFLAPDRTSRLAQWAGEVLKSSPESLQRKVAEALAVLTVKDWEYLADLAQRMKNAQADNLPGQPSSKEISKK